MMEPTTEGGLSLLPYLAGRASGLRLTLTDVSTAADGTPLTLPAPDAAGPFTALWKARVTVDGLQALADVFLLIQPDHYAQAPSTLGPVTNSQVEAFWQALAVRLQAQAAGRGPVLLPGQTDAQRGLIALRPLFYCRHRQRFAHPLCPQCGGVLTLCQDDRMLRAAALPTCSDSLMRFLYCPSCQEPKSFYAREVSQQAPSHVHDARYLVEAFSRLLGREELRDELPCVGCPETTACYGAQTLVHQRMASLCFYPFHMLMLPAPTIGSEYVNRLWLNDLHREIQAPLANVVPTAAVAPPAVAPPVPEAPVPDAPIPEAVVEAVAEEADARIAGILRTILTQWPDDGAAAPKAAVAVPPLRGKMAPLPPPDEDGDCVQTIILGAAPQPAAPAKPPVPPPSPDMEQTVLIQPPPAGGANTTPPEDFQATVLISPAQAGPAKPPAEQDLEQTVLIRPSQEAPQAPADDLEQTVLMSAPQQGLRPPQAPPPAPPQMPPAAPPRPPEPDDLAETVIIAPDPNRDRRPKP